MKTETFDKAKEFFELKMWRKFYSSDIFVMDLPSGRRGYCCILGEGDEDICFSVFLGDEGLNGMYGMLLMDNNNSEDHLISALQESLHCYLLEENEVYAVASEKEAREYERRTKRSATFMGKRIAIESLHRFHDLVPVHGEDEVDMMAALDLAIYIGKALEGVKDYDRAMLAIGFFTHDQAHARKLPLFTKDGAKYSVRMIPHPNPEHLYRYYQPKLPQDDRMEIVARRKGDRLYDCEMGLRVFLMDQANGKGGYEEYYALSLFQAHLYKAYIDLPMFATGTKDEDLDELLEFFLNQMHDVGKPSKIYYGDESTRMFLKEFCEKLDIQLEYKKKLELLDEDFADISNGVSAKERDDAREKMVELILRMPEDKLAAMPMELVRVLRHMFADLPREVQERLHKYLFRA